MNDNPRPVRGQKIRVVVTNQVNRHGTIMLGEITQVAPTWVKVRIIETGNVVTLSRRTRHSKGGHCWAWGGTWA